MPDQSGKVAIVTGGNSGLGYESVLALARKNARVVMASRTPSRGEAALADVKKAHPAADVEVMQLDLSSLISIRAFVPAFAEKYDRLDILMNNAGVMATPPSKTKDGLELQIGTNHFGHFALTGLLIELLHKTPASRVINVSSLAANSGQMNYDDIMHEQNYSRFSAYAQSKLANLVFTQGLAQWAKLNEVDVVSVAAHPGGSRTNLSSGMKMPRLVSAFGSFVFGLMAQSAEQGALPQLYAAVGENVSPGDYFGPDGRGGMVGLPAKIPMTRAALDQNSIDRLWQLSEELTKVTFTH